MMYALFFVLGLVLGSFGNVLISRLPQGRTIGGRSQCPHCGKILEVRELIPLISYMIQRGQCRGCGREISQRYPLVELASGLLFLLALTFAASSVEALILAFALWFLLLIAVIDAEQQRIPDVLNIPFVFLGILFNALSGSVDPSGFFLGGGFFAVFWGVSRGRWMGSGDIILGAGIGALLGGFKEMLLCLLFAYVAGALVAAFLLLSGRKTRKDRLAFGPFLALGALLTLFLGDQAIPLLFPL